MIVPLGHDETEGQGSTDNGEKMTHTHLVFTESSQSCPTLGQSIFSLVVCFTSFHKFVDWDQDGSPLDPFKASYKYESYENS